MIVSNIKSSKNIGRFNEIKPTPRGYSRTVPKLALTLKFNKASELGETLYLGRGDPVYGLQTRHSPDLYT